SWVYQRTRDPVLDDIVLRAQALFPSDAALAITFECRLGAAKRLAAHLRALDDRTKEPIKIPVEDARASDARGSVYLDEAAPQPAFLFPERGEEQASIVEIPLTSEDNRKNTPRAEAWLRHYRVILKIRTARGEASATIFPYADNLRRVLEACAN